MRLDCTVEAIVSVVEAPTCQNHRLLMVLHFPLVVLQVTATFVQLLLVPAGS